jgi:hypothetical protein
MKTRILAAVILAGILSGTAAPADVESKDVAAMRVTFRATVQEFNRAGRLATSGVIGGFANNVWQTVWHSSDPASLGCVGQTSSLANHLREEFPGWAFDQRFEFGFDSPIFLPHAWITARNGHGEKVDLDPWTNEFTVRKAGK